jgi:gliding motility-associated-like protein
MNTEYMNFKLKSEMNKNYKYYLIFLIAFLNLKVQAAHIIGGDVIYKCTGKDTVRKTTGFDIFFTMYRDSKGGGAIFDSDAEFGLFRSVDGGKSWAYVKSVITSPRDIGEVTYENPCIIVPPSIGVEKAVYNFQFDLPWNTGIYQIAYQRCCRNGTITNIIDPGSTGAVFSIEISETAILDCNNSPVYTKFPPIVICAGEPLLFDHSAIDQEGDQILYEFCAPLQSGGRQGDGTTGGDPTGCMGVRPSPLKCAPPYREVAFQLPTFSTSNPVGGLPQMAINAVSGLITGTPNITGQYVVGVCAKEFRNGKLLSIVRRDFQFNVTQCQIAVDAIIEPDVQRITEGYVEYKRENNVFKFKSCGSNFIPFVNKSIQDRNIKGYKWKLNIENQVDSFNTKDLDYTFNKTGLYTGLMIVNPDLSNCSDTAKIEIEIYPKIEADFTYKYDTCIAGPISFTDQSLSPESNITNWSWQFNAKDTSSQASPVFEYKTPGEKDITLTITDSNKCRSTLKEKITYLPVPALLVIEPTQFTGCVPANIFFNNLSFPIDTTYKIEWDFGDGKKGDDISPSHVYDSIGLYDVSIKITSPIGCSTEKFYPQWIEALESPTANFSYAPLSLNNFNRTATFVNNSIKEDFINWDFSGKGNSDLEQPTFTFPDTGLYKVTLYAFHNNGCFDTATASIDVEPIVTLKMPNAFTPNNDGLNDDFKGYGYLEGLTNYKMTIWNRWGEEIFTSKDPYLGWNGEKDNAGSLSPQGVYVYLVDYLSPRGEQKSLKGHITLVR